MTAAPSGAAGGGDQRAGSEPTAELVRRASEQVSQLVRQEMRLAVEELRGKGRHRKGVMSKMFYKASSMVFSALGGRPAVGLVKAGVDRLGAQCVRKVTGCWPGDEKSGRSR